MIEGKDFRCIWLSRLEQSNAVRRHVNIYACTTLTLLLVAIHWATAQHNFDAFRWHRCVCECVYKSFFFNGTY